MSETEKSSLGDLMKEAEHAYRRRIDPSSYLLLRLDGKSFHTYTRGLKKPYDADLMEAMDLTLLSLCAHIPGVRLGYVESDEISLLITAFREVGVSEDSPDGLRRGELWMGGVEAKLLSLSAAHASVTFNEVRRQQASKMKLDGEDLARFHRGPALFDARLWTFPGDDQGAELVKKYFLWRRRDSIKNSVTMAALDRYSPRAIHGMKTEEKQAKLAEDGHPWDSLPEGFRTGRYAVKTRRVEEVAYTHKKTGERHSTMVERAHWQVEPRPEFETLFDGETLPQKQA